MRKLTFIALCLALCGLVGPQLDSVHGQAGVGADLQVAQLLDQIEAGSARKTRVEGELLSLAAQRDQRRGQLKQRLRALYRITRAGVAPMAGGLEAVLSHVARVKRLERIVTRDAAELQSLDARTQALRGEANDLARGLEQARGQLGSAQQIQALGRDPASDRFLGTFGGGPDVASQDAPEAQGFYGLRVLGEDDPGEGFASKRGSLGMPVAGEVRVRDGKRDESDGPGLEFEVPAGTAVRAVESGRVAFSDVYGSYGRLVILDHGDGYYTVYGGLGAVEVRVGDDVSRRARIASVGDATPPALFFEVRQGTRTLSPRSWLGM